MRKVRLCQGASAGRATEGNAAMQYATIESSLHYRPDEPDTGSDAPTPETPETLDIDGEVLPRDEVVRRVRQTREFERANHERATVLKRDREQLEADRAAFRTEREGRRAESNAIVETLRSLTPKPETPEDRPLSFADLLEQEKVDPVGDEEGVKKLGQLWDRTREEDATRLERRLRAEFEGRLASTTQQLEGRVQQAARTVEQQRARDRAIQDVDRANRQLLERRLRAKHAELAEQLSEEDREGLYAAMGSLVGRASDGTPYGQLDSMSLYHWTDQAVDDAMWVHKPTRQLLLARETATARRDGMLGGVRGEEASRSTPTRVQRRTGEGGDDALVAKWDRTRQLLRAGQITPDQALATFDDKERARLKPWLTDGRARRD